VDGKFAPPAHSISLVNTTVKFLIGRVLKSAVELNFEFATYSSAKILSIYMSQLPLITEPLPLSKLESKLWEAANILRGSPVDRTDWKSYILPLLFFKRICDVWDEGSYAEMVVC
jgi:hypothetical protein